MPDNKPSREEMKKDYNEWERTGPHTEEERQAKIKKSLKEHDFSGAITTGSDDIRDMT